MEIIERNVRLMRSRESGGMLFFLANAAESVGGNAGVHVSPKGRKYPCGAANFLYDAETGEIYRFTIDTQRIDSPDGHGSLIVAGYRPGKFIQFLVEYGDINPKIFRKIRIMPDIQYRVVETYLDHPIYPAPAENARRAIQKSVEVFYSGLGWDFD